MSYAEQIARAAVVIQRLAELIDREKSPQADIELFLARGMIDDWRKQFRIDR